MNSPVVNAPAPRFPCEAADVHDCITVPVNDLRDLLGYDVLLLHWPLVSKGTRRKWGHLTIEAMNDPAYLEKLSTGNVGVALGDKSNGLCAIDLDLDDEVAPFIAANPLLEQTLQTHGARGRVFWIRMRGDYPGTFTFKTSTGKQAGEFRSHGSQSIISGIHPATRMPYRMVRASEPVVIEFEKLTFPNGIQESRIKPAPTTIFPLCPLLPLLPLCEPADAVGMALPRERHQNHKCLFLLARAVKTLEANGVIKGIQKRIEIFDEWHRQASGRGVLREGQTRDEYLLEFLDACRCAKQVLGATVADRAWALAQTEPLPPESAVFKTERGKRFIGLCYQMERISKRASWFIPTRTVARLLGVSWKSAANWFNALVDLGILSVIEEPTFHAATHYRYNVKEQPKNRKRPIAKNL